MARALERPLDASDGAGAQLSARDGRAHTDWRPRGDLTPLEEEMIAGAAAGGLVDRGEGPFNLAEMRAWAAERTVRASRLLAAQDVVVLGRREAQILDLVACGPVRRPASPGPAAQLRVFRAIAAVVVGLVPGQDGP